MPRLTSLSRLILHGNDKSRIYSKSALLQDANVKKVISEQTTQWSAMVERQRKEEWEMLKNQTEAGREEFKKLIEIVQASQVKQLQAKHDKCVDSISNFSLVFLFVRFSHKILA